MKIIVAIQMALTNVFVPMVNLEKEQKKEGADDKMYS